MTAHIHLLTQCLGTAYCVSDALQWEYKNDRDSHSPLSLQNSESEPGCPGSEEKQKQLDSWKPPPVYLEAAVVQVTSAA